MLKPGLLKLASAVGDAGDAVVGAVLPPFVVVHVVTRR